MKIANVIVSGVSARAEGCEKIPKGITGAQIGLEFTDAAWEGLQKTVVFCGSETKTILNAGELVTIPREVVSTVGVDLMVGVCGTDAQGTVMIPTLWAELGKVWGAALPTEDTSTDAALPVWAQLQAMVGNLEELTTEDRESLVKAVNELAARGVGEDGASAYEIAKAHGYEGSEEAWLESLKGNTPVKGTDYWTQADQESMVQQVVAALGTPVFGTVDADNNIILTGNLVDGTYALKYEDAEGNQTDIGTVKVGVTHTNLAGTVTYDVRLSSSGATKQSEGAATTDYVPVYRGDVVRVKGLTIIGLMPDGNGASVVGYTDTAGTTTAVYYPSAHPAAFVEADGVTTWTVFTVGTETAEQDSAHADGVQYYIRLCGTPVSGEEIVVTVNEEIW